MPYKCRHFDIQELVAPELLAVLSEDLAWRLIPGEVVWGLDTLRSMLNRPIWINGKGLTECGIRSLITQTGAKMSGHKGYRGETCFDLHCDDLPALEQIVRTNHVSLGIGRMENPAKTKGWIHITFVKGAQNLEVFDP